MREDILVAGVGFEPTTSRLCLPSTVFTASVLNRICGLDFLFTFVFTLRCLPLSLYTFPACWPDLARDYQ